MAYNVLLVVSISVFNDSIYIAIRNQNTNQARVITDKVQLKNIELTGLHQTNVYMVRTASIWIEERERRQEKYYSIL